ncbi:hypothetical protein O181_087526 [Austropuccinia psidii MF-1]|uniref:CCHC-type domain-containing protein n=1 Tax=Austropuccinia psidii MF-1 TaxID=1389203 RepID=A0A9Q3IPT9_9BASI|nr:hypothetical protein [Austropuccinia psidii MF-1]
MVHMKILKTCGEELGHALRSRCIEPCSTEEYINALEEIVTRTKIGRTWNKLDIKSPNKPFIKKDKPRETFKPNISNSNEQREFHKCGGSGHLANNCLKKAKINEIVETEDHNDKEEESDSEKDTEESDSEKDTEESDSEKDTEESDSEKDTEESDSEKDTKESETLKGMKLI